MGISSSNFSQQSFNKTFNENAKFVFNVFQQNCSNTSMFGGQGTNATPQSGNNVNFQQMVANFFANFNNNVQDNSVFNTGIDPPFTSMPVIPQPNITQSFPDNINTNAGLPSEERLTGDHKLNDTEVNQIFQKVADEKGIPIELLYAVLRAENDGRNPQAKNKQDGGKSYGLMQTIPLIHNAYGNGGDRGNALNSAMGAGGFLADLMDKYGGDTDKVLQAYNLGETRFDKGARNPDYLARANRGMAAAGKEMAKLPQTSVDNSPASLPVHDDISLNSSPFARQPKPTIIDMTNQPDKSNVLVKMSAQQLGDLMKKSTFTPTSVKATTDGNLTISAEDLSQLQAPENLNVYKDTSLNSSPFEKKQPNFLEGLQKPIIQ